PCSCALCCVSVSSVPAPSRSSPFPYTTLFRSVGRACQLPLSRRCLVAHDLRPCTCGRAPRLPDRAPGRRPGADQALDRGVGARGDRKSTRLNSSHEWISYAVFCLKKKTKTTPH